VLLERIREHAGAVPGRTLRARRPLNGGEFRPLTVLVEAAQQKLATLQDR
jgi:hypothetical protein